MTTDAVNPYYFPTLDRTSTVGPQITPATANYTSSIRMISNNAGLPQTSGATPYNVAGVTGPPIAVFGQGATSYVPGPTGTAPTPVLGNPPTATGGAPVTSNTTILALAGVGLLAALLFL